MTIAHGVISSVLLSGIVFAASTLPLGMFGAEPITLKVGDRPTFTGRFDELATPYLAFTTLLSVGIGVATVSMAGWQSASQKLSQAEEKMAALKQQIQETEALLEHFKFSDQKLHSTGLNAFLEPNLASSQAVPPASAPLHNGDDRRANHVSPVNLYQPPHAQGVGSTRGSDLSLAELSSSDLKNQAQVEMLLDNLKQVVHQIEKLKAS